MEADDAEDFCCCMEYTDPVSGDSLELQEGGADVDVTNANRREYRCDIAVCNAHNTHEQLPCACAAPRAQQVRHRG